MEVGQTPPFTYYELLESLKSLIFKEYKLTVRPVEQYRKGDDGDIEMRFIFENENGAVEVEDLISDILGVEVLVRVY